MPALNGSLSGPILLNGSLSGPILIIDVCSMDRDRVTVVFQLSHWNRNVLML